MRKFQKTNMSMIRLSVFAMVVMLVLINCSKNTDEFVAVSDILDIPTVVEVNKPLTLSATVISKNTTNKTIAWSTKAAGTTGQAL